MSADETTDLSPTQRMDRAVSLVPKLVRIVQARGWTPNPTDDNAETAALAEIQKELPSQALPRDYMALYQAGLTGCTWCLDPLYVKQPSGLLKCIRDLRKVYSGNNDDEYTMKPGLPLEWTEENSLVPFGLSSSAFYLGWIITDPTDHWPIVQLEGEQSLARNRQENCPVPLVELLYRHVVRAVTPDEWNAAPESAIVYFWNTEQEAEDLERGHTRYAIDGSQDISKSTKEAIVVLGRVVLGYDEDPDDDEDDDDEEDGREEAKRAKPNPGSLFDNGTTEEDFNALGVYGVLHPIDLKEEEKARILDSAETIAITTVKSSHPTPFSKLDASVRSVVVDQTLCDRMEEAQPWEASMSVSGYGPVIIAEDGKDIYGPRSVLPISYWGMDMSEDPFSERLSLMGLPSKGILTDGETLQQVCAGDQGFLALTSQGRVLSWGRATVCGRQKQPSYQNQLEPGVVEAFPCPVARLAVADDSAAALLTDGSVYFWGSAIDCPIPVPKEEVVSRPETHGLPILIHVPPAVLEEAGPIVELAVGSQQLLFLHQSGRVTRYRSAMILAMEREMQEAVPNTELETLSIPEPVVQLSMAGDHVLFLTVSGKVYGIGNGRSGQLPLPTTTDDVSKWQREIDAFEESMTAYRQKIRDYRQQVLDFAKTCPRPDDASPAGEEAGEDDEQDVDRFFQYSAFVTVRNRVIQTVKGVHYHSNFSNAEGAKCPPMPKDLIFGPSPPKENQYLTGRPSLGTDTDEPTLCMIGPEHGRLHEEWQALKEDANKETILWKKTPQNAWNAITGPYGLPKGSFAPVMSAVGCSSVSLFLHATGELSGSGSGTSLCLGIRPYNDDDEEEEEEENDEDENMPGGEADGKDEKEKEEDDDKMKEEGDEQGADEEEEGTPPSWALCSLHMYCGGHQYVSCLQEIGSPLAVTDHKLVAENLASIVTGRAGTVVVDRLTGAVHGCGQNLGQKEISVVLVPLEYTEVNMP